MLMNNGGADYTPKGKFNEPLYGLSGSYKFLEERSLPYFVSTMPLERFKNEIKISDEGEPNFNRKWNLEEIFQRELDKDRVRDDIVNGYLRDPESKVFFNAITVVLMPLTGKTDNPVGDSFQPLTESSPRPNIPFDGDKNSFDNQWASTPQIGEIEGIQYQRFADTDPSALNEIDFARLRWDKEKVFAVAVDGQHRLAAIREFWDTADTTKFEVSRIPVIFVLASPEFGMTYKLNEELSLPIRTLSRSIFTDLNKTQENVDDIRTLILDDTDLPSKCLRELVTPSTHDFGKYRDKLSLAMINWKGTGDKIDDNFYLNTMQNLDWLITMYFSQMPVVNPQDVDSVIDSFKDLKQRLGADGKIEIAIRTEDGKEVMKDIEEYYKDRYCTLTDDELIAHRMWRKIPPLYIKRCVELFKETHMKYLIACLTEVAPYDRVIRYWSRHNLVEGQFGGYQVQTKGHQKALQIRENAKNSNWHANTIVSVEEDIKKMKNNGNGNLLWKLIFQRGMVLAGKDLINGHKLCTITEYITFIDELVDKGIFDDSHQITSNQGSVYDHFARKKGGQIWPGPKQTVQIQRLIMLWWYASNYQRKKKSSKAKKTTDEILSDLGKPTYGMKPDFIGCTDTYTTFRKDWPTNKQLNNLNMDDKSLNQDQKNKIRDDQIALIVTEGIINLDISNKKAEIKDELRGVRKLLRELEKEELLEEVLKDSFLEAGKQFSEAKDLDSLTEVDNGIKELKSTINKLIENHDAGKKSKTDENEAPVEAQNSDSILEKEEETKPSKTGSAE
jgi:DGQHR domain-containing protein